MTDACGFYRAWLAEHGVEAAPPAMELHLTECDGCREISKRYCGAVEVFREATDRAEPVGGFDVVRREAIARRRQARWRWASVAVVAACGVAVVWAGVLRAPEPGPSEPDTRLFAAKLPSSARVVAPSGGVVREADEVSAGAVVETFGGEVTLADPLTATLSVAPGSRLRVSEWARTAAVVSLDRGRVRAQVEKRSVGQRFEVVTDEATVRVVGTDFTVERAAGAGTLVTTLSGVVAVESPAGALLATVRAGQSFRVGAREVLLREEEAAHEPEPTRVAITSRGRERETPRAREAELAPAPPPPAPEPTPRRVVEASHEHTVIAPPLARPGVPPDPPSTDAHPARPEQRSVVAARVEPVHPDDTGVAPSAPLAAGAEPGGDGGDPVVLTPTQEDTPPPAALSPDAILERARRLLARGAGGDEEAVAVLEQAVRTPSAMRGRLLALLADAYRIAGRPADARRAYERALADESGCPRGVVSDLATLLETDLDRATDARVVWEEALRRDPDGALAARAHAELARLLRASDPAAADAHEGALVRDFPAAPEATRAFVAVGRRLLDAGRWGDAAAWFEPNIADPSPRRAEAAMVGLMRARIGQSRVSDARALAERYSRSFPSGERKAEVERMVEALDEAQ